MKRLMVITMLTLALTVSAVVVGQYSLVGIAHADDDGGGD